MAETKQGGFHRAWLVFIGVCMMMAGGMGLILNVVGNYFPVMAMEFGLTTPDGGLDVAPVTLLMTVAASLGTQLPQIFCTSKRMRIS